MMFESIAVLLYYQQKMKTENIQYAEVNALEARKKLSDR